MLNTINGAISISLLVEKGRISEASITGAIPTEISQKIAVALLGCRHDYEAVKTALFVLNEEFRQNGILVDELIIGLF